MSDDIQRTLGEHGAKLESLESAIKDIGADVKTLVASENQRKGMMKTITAVAAGAGAIASFIAQATVEAFKK